MDKLLVLSMRLGFTILLLIALLSILLGCAQKPATTPEPTPKPANATPTPTEVKTKIDVKLEFSQFPTKYTCDGEDISPKIEIYGIRDDVKSLAIIVDDPDAPLGTFNHWIIWNIEPTNIIPEGIPKEYELTSPIKAVQGKNDFGKVGYNGPCPPPGKPHRYFFKVYALDTFFDLKAGSAKGEVEKAIEGHVIQYGEAVATYGR